MVLKRFAPALSLGLLGVAVLLSLFNISRAPAQAASTYSIPASPKLNSASEPSLERRLQGVTPVHYVATAGVDSGDCGTPEGACRTVQYAVDRAGEGDQVRIAAGVYTGTQARPAPPGLGKTSTVTQVVYISKSITLRGGYTTTDWNLPNPILYPTTLDAEDRGRVIFVTGHVNPFIEGLKIVRGRAEGSGGTCHLGSNPSECGAGGGIHILTATVAIRSCEIYSSSGETGGGVHIELGAARLDSTVVSSNTAEVGGGISAGFGSVEINASELIFNSSGFGGGLWAVASDVVANHNLIAHNHADSHGGGMYLEILDTARLNANRIVSNTAALFGGGICAWDSESVLDNNFIAYNSGTYGSGLALRDGSHASLRHNTIVFNTGGQGSGIYLSSLEDNGNSVVMSNTILFGNKVGIDVTYKSTARLDGTLWGNATDWMVEGDITTGTVNLWGDPAFVAPLAGDYHILDGSMAADAGISVGVVEDIDGDPRPAGTGYDIGADELHADLDTDIQAAPIPVRPGAPLTYTIFLTNTGLLELNARITDLLPADVAPSGTIFWNAAIPTNGGVWTQTVVVTVNNGYVGPLTDVLRVTTLEGVTGVTTHTLAPDLALTKHAVPDPVETGERLTYTIALTNTGDFYLSATISDALPAYVTPAEILTWDPVEVSPGDSWHQTVVVTVQPGYAGSLTNAVTATATGGIRRVYTCTTTLPLRPGVQIGPDSWGSSSPGAVVTYSHTLTNAGNIRDVFDLAYDSSQDWAVQVDTPVAVDAYHTAPIQVSVFVPAAAVSGTLDTTTITAVSRSAQEISDGVVDVTLVDHLPGIAFTPNQHRLTNPDRVITYSFVLSNTGNGPDVIQLSHQSGQGWHVAHPTFITLGHEEHIPVNVLVTVPPGSDGLVDVTVITATSEADVNVSGTAWATTTVNSAPIANAGQDLYVGKSDVVLLDGSASIDPDGHLPLTYRWRRTGGPVVILVDPDAVQAAFQAPPYQSTLTFTLTVTDAMGLRSIPDTVVTYVGREAPSNQPPYRPACPIPADGASDVPLSSTLHWPGGDPDGDAVTYTVTFGTENPPPVVETTASTAYTPSLTAATTYYWMITATDGISTVTGQTWHFTSVAPEAPFSGRIFKKVSPDEPVFYGDELTYTLTISAIPGTRVGLYDQLMATTFDRFVNRPEGVIHAQGVITGSVLVTPTNQVSVGFVARVDVPSTPGRTATVSNRACIYQPGRPLDDCIWSDLVETMAFWSYAAYLPLILLE